MSRSTSSHPLDIIRIYLSNRRRRVQPGILGRLFPGTLASALLRGAHHAGVTTAMVTIGQAGFAAGARRVAIDHGEMQDNGLPICLELIGTADTLEAFLSQHHDELTDTVIVRLNGAGHLR